VKSTDELSAVLSYSLPEQINQAYHQWELASLLRCLPAIAGKSVLDLACGVGRLTVPLARTDALVTAADNSPEMLERCRANVASAGMSHNVRFEQGDAIDLSFPSESFDVVVCLGLLEHLPPDVCRKAVLEIGRITRVGGVAVLIMNNGRSAFLNQEQHYQMAGQREDGYYCGIVDERAVLSTLTENGFRCSYEASNTFQSIGKHLLRHYVSRDLNRPILDALFKLCAELDIEFRNKGDLDQLFADQFLVKAEKICAR
jgi:ubiquinone/menaquinone biosynthesis C-methylase UbiE